MKIVFVISFQDFRDEEYFVPKEILKSKGFRIMTVSSETGKAIGADGGEVTINKKIKDLNIEKIDALVFAGGPGCLKHLDNEDSYQLIQEAHSKNKLIAAICISPVILAKAGVLEGKKATVWSKLLDKSAIDILEENGAIFEDSGVVLDDNIITSKGPDFAKDFGLKIFEALT